MIAVVVGRKFGKFVNDDGDTVKFAKLYCISQQKESSYDGIINTGFESYEAKVTVDEANALSDWDILDIQYTRTGKVDCFEVIGKCDPIKI